MSYTPPKPRLEPCQVFLRYAGASSFIVFTLFLAVGTWQVATLPTKVGNEVASVKKDVLQRLDTLGGRLDTTDKKFNLLLEHTDNYLNSDDVLANLETTTVILKSVSDILDRVSTKTLPGVDGLVEQAGTSLNKAGDLLAGIQKDADRLTDDAAPLKEALSNVGALLATLNEQVKAGGPEVAETARRLQKVLDDTDRLLSDPKLAETLSNVDDTTKNVAETTKSVDIYLRPLRAKFSLLKTAINKALDMLKFTVPFF